ncbi:MAG: radical SAM protein [Candidatus Hydrogenedentes bacterium]|nr:radical SAM protein [Candidatus Hydrogenedentota bacterium]
MNSNMPPIAVLFLHPGCNMTCTFCVTENSFSAMRFDQALRLLDLLRTHRVDTVVLGGGEPFTWRHSLIELTREAKARRFFVQVGTNGTMLPENFENIPSIDRYVLPLDAADASTHNELRHYQDRHHSVILERMARLRTARKSVTISTVVTAQNIGALPAIADLLAQYSQSGGQLHAWHLYKFIPQGRGGRKNAGSLDICEDAYQTACAEVKQRNPGLLVYKRRDMFHSRTVDFYWYHREAIQIGSEVWSRPQPQVAAYSSGQSLPAAADAFTS